MKQTFDFTESKEFELKTSKGATVLREPTPEEYFNYLDGASSEGREIRETYEFYVEYFKTLGGGEDAIRSLTLNQMFDVAMAVNGVEGKDPQKK
jgi:hypothetical protein